PPSRTPAVPRTHTHAPVEAPGLLPLPLGALWLLGHPSRGLSFGSEGATGQVTFRCVTAGKAEGAARQSVLWAETSGRQGHAEGEMHPCGRRSPLRASQRPPPTGPLVRWRDPERANAWGWVDALGAGPFEVVGLVDHGAHRIRRGLVLKSRLGGCEGSGGRVEPGGGAGGVAPGTGVARPLPGGVGGGPWV